MGPGSDTPRVQMARKSRVFSPPSAPAAYCGPDFTVRGPYGSSAGTTQSRITGLISPVEVAVVQLARVERPTCGTQGALQDSDGSQAVGGGVGGQ